MASESVFVDRKERSRAVSFLRELGGRHANELYQWTEKDDKGRLWFWVGIKVNESKNIDFENIDFDRGLATGLLQAADFFASYKS